MKKSSKKTNPLLGKSLVVCALIALGFVLTDICFFSEGFQTAFANGKYADLANYCFYLIGFSSIVLYGLFFYKKSPAFYRGLLIFSACFFALMIGTRISLLSYAVEYTGVVNAKRIARIIQVVGLFVFAIIAFMIGLVASRLSQKERNRFILNCASVLAWMYGIISTFTSLFILNKLSTMSLPDIATCLSDLVPALYMTAISVSFVLGSEARHSDEAAIDEE